MDGQEGEAAALNHAEKETEAAKTECCQTTEQKEVCASTNLQGDSGALAHWFDLDLEDPIILPSCFAHFAYFSSAKAEGGSQWNSQIQVNPTQVRDLLNHLVGEVAG